MYRHRLRLRRDDPAACRARRARGLCAGHGLVAAARLSDVFDAVVVGVPDDRYVEIVAALVQPRAGAEPSLDELQAHCRDKLAGYKLPRRLVLIDAIPRTPIGKPDYRVAKTTALKHHTQGVGSAL